MLKTAAAGIKKARAGQTVWARTRNYWEAIDRSARGIAAVSLRAGGMKGTRNARPKTRIAEKNMNKPNQIV